MRLGEWVLMHDTIGELAICWTEQQAQENAALCAGTGNIWIEHRLECRLCGSHSPCEHDR